MSNSNTLLAIRIIDILKEKKLINPLDRQLVKKLADGQMKEADWKIALEEMITKAAAAKKRDTDETT